MNMSDHGTGKHRHENGVGLIEILLAVLLISIGFLAAAKMQIQGMRDSQSAYYQSQAYLLANDMIDRMRSNIGGVIDGDYDGFATSAAATNPGCGTSVCTDKQQSQQDLFDLSARLHALNGENGFVSALSSTESVAAIGTVSKLEDGVYEVTLRWGEIVNGRDQAQSLTMNFAAEIPN